MTRTIWCIYIDSGLGWERRCSLNTPQQAKREALSYRRLHPEHRVKILKTLERSPALCSY